MWTYNPFTHTFDWFVTGLTKAQADTYYVPYTGATGDVSLGTNQLNSGNVYPTTNFTYDLGSASYAWNNVYTKNIWFPQATSAVELYADYNTFGSRNALAIAAYGGLNVYTGGAKYYIFGQNGDLYPTSNGGQNLGLSTNYWENVYGTAFVTASGTAGQFVKGNGSLDSSTYLTVVTPHNILSTTHGDTLADTVVRGDILYGNATPKWARLPFPATPTGKILQATATDVAWSSNPITIGASASVSGSNTGDQTLAGLGGQPALSGTGFVKASGTTITYDNSTYLTSLAGAWLLNGNTNGAKKTLGSIDNYDIGFLTNNTERMTILAGGNVGIGTTSPTLAKLQVAGAIGILEGGATPTKYTIFQGGDQTVDLTYTLPTGLPASTGFMKSTASGTMSWDTNGYGLSSDHYVVTQTASDLSNSVNLGAFGNGTNGFIGIGITAGAASLSAFHGNTTTTRKFIYSVGDGFGTEGAPTWDVVKDSDISFAATSTGNASTSKHGYLPQLDNTSTHFLNGQGGWTTPAGGGGGSPGGSSGDFQYNNGSGAFTGSGILHWDGNTVSITNNNSGHNGFKVEGYDDGNVGTGILAIYNQNGNMLASVAGDAGYWQGGWFNVFGNTDSNGADMGTFTFNNPALFPSDARVADIVAKRGSGQNNATMHFQVWNGGLQDGMVINEDASCSINNLHISSGDMNGNSLLTDNGQSFDFQDANGNVIHVNQGLITGQN